MLEAAARRDDVFGVRSSRAVPSAVLAALVLLPLAPASADHVGGFTPPSAPTPPPHVVHHTAGRPVLQPLPLLGPRVRVRRTVAPGDPVVLPATTGRIKVVCTGPTMRGALLWLEQDPRGRTSVRRYDGGRAYDFTYRVVRGGVSTTRETCP